MSPATDRPNCRTMALSKPGSTSMTATTPSSPPTANDFFNKLLTAAPELACLRHAQVVGIDLTVRGKSVEAQAGPPAWARIEVRFIELTLPCVKS